MIIQYIILKDTYEICNKVKEQNKVKTLKIEKALKIKDMELLVD